MNAAAFLTQASDYAADLDRIFWLLVVISSLIMLLVGGLVLTFSIRYRRGSRAPRGELPEALKREVEIGWTAATLFLFLFVFWWAASSQLSALNNPAHALEVHVVAE